MADDNDDDTGTETLERPDTTTETDKAPEAKAPVETKPAGSLAQENWRDQIVSGLPETDRPKAQEWLKNRSSPFDVLRAGMSADARISELTRDRVKVPTGKNDDPKELTAFRKTWGVPEDASGYKVEIPKEYGAELVGQDKELLEEFLTDAHSKNMNQAQVDHAIKAYWSVQQRVQAAQQAQIATVQQQAVDELHVHFGREYRPTVELINRMFESELKEVGLTEPEQRREFLSQRFQNGMALGEYPPFVKMMAKIARERSDDGALIMGESHDGEDLDAKIDKIIGIRNTDIKEYERMQPELNRLIAAQNRRKARK